MTTDLARVAAFTAARARRRKAYAKADAEWRQAIMDALTGGYGPGEVAKVAGVTQPRITQIGQEGR